MTDSFSLEPSPHELSLAPWGPRDSDTIGRSPADPIGRSSTTNDHFSMTNDELVVSESLCATAAPKVPSYGPSLSTVSLSPTRRSTTGGDFPSRGDHFSLMEETTTTFTTAPEPPEHPGTSVENLTRHKRRTMDVVHRSAVRQLLPRTSPSGYHDATCVATPPVSMSRLCGEPMLPAATAVGRDCIPPHSPRRDAPIPHPRGGPPLRDDASSDSPTEVRFHYVSRLVSPRVARDCPIPNAIVCLRGGTRVRMNLAAFDAELVHYKGTLVDDGNHPTFGRSSRILGVEPVALALNAETYRNFVQHVVSRALPFLPAIAEAFVLAQGIVDARSCWMDDEGTGRGADGAPNFVVTPMALRSGLLQCPDWQEWKGRSVQERRHSRRTGAGGDGNTGGDGGAGGQFAVAAWLGSVSWGHVFLDAEWMADFWVVQQHPSLLTTVTMSDLKTLTFREREVLMRRTGVLPMMAFWPEEVRSCMHRSWWEDVLQRSAVPDRYPEIISGGIGLVRPVAGLLHPPVENPPSPDDADRVLARYWSGGLPPVKGDIYMDPTAVDRKCAPCVPRPCTPPPVPEQTPQGQTPCVGENKSSTPDVVHRHKEEQDDQDEQDTQDEQGTQDDPAVEALSDGMPGGIVVAPASLFMVTMLRDPDDPHGCALMRAMLTPEQYRIVWLYELLNLDQQRSQNTRFEILSRNEKASPCPPPTASTTSSVPVLPFQRLTVKFASFEPWQLSYAKRTEGHPQSATRMRVADLHRQLATAYHKIYGHTMPCTPTRHHDELVSLCRLGGVVVRSDSAAPCGGGRGGGGRGAQPRSTGSSIIRSGGRHRIMCFLRTNWNACCTASDILQQILCRSLVRACMDPADVVDLDCDGLTAQQEKGRLQRANFLVRHTLRQHPYLHSLKEAEFDATVAPLMRSCPRAQLDPQQQIARVAAGCFPLTMFVGSAGTGKTAVLPYLQGTDELITATSSTDGQKDIASHAQVRIVTPNNTLKNRISQDCRPAHTLAYLETYAHYNNAFQRQRSTAIHRPMSRNLTIEDRNSHVRELVMDEVGMVGELAFARHLIMQAGSCPLLDKVLWLTDRSQLSSREPGDVAGDLMALPQVCVVKMATNHRSGNARELAEFATSVAAIGVAFQPGRLTTPHLPTIRSVTEAFQHADQRSGIEPTGPMAPGLRALAAWAPFPGQGEDATRRFTERRTRVLQMASLTPEHAKSLCTTPPMERRSALLLARDLAQRLWAQSQGSADDRPGKKPRTSLSLSRWSTGHVRRMRSMHHKDPSEHHILSFQNKTRTAINQQFVAHDTTGYPSTRLTALVVGMKVRFSSKFSAETYDGKSVTISANQLAVVQSIRRLSAERSSAPPVSSAKGNSSPVPGRRLKSTSDSGGIWGDVELVSFHLLNQCSPRSRAGQPGQEASFIPFTDQLLRSLDHGWSSTVYSMQGVEVPVVVTALDDVDNQTLYTAVTRGKKAAELVSHPDWCRKPRKGHDDGSTVPVECLVRAMTKASPQRTTALGWITQHRDRLRPCRWFDPLSSYEYTRSAEIWTRMASDEVSRQAVAPPPVPDDGLYQLARPWFIYAPCEIPLVIHTTRPATSDSFSMDIDSGTEIPAPVPTLSLATTSTGDAFPSWF
jgi:hypothetical protein